MYPSLAVNTPRRSLAARATVGLVAWWALSGLSSAAAPESKAAAAKEEASRKETKKQSTPRFVPPEAWHNSPPTPVTASDIDGLLAKELQTAKIPPAPVTGDEQFIRRVTLDLTGRLPAPADVDGFVTDKDPNKRARLIDRLLDSEDCAHHWAKYWRDVIGARATATQPLLRAGREASLETWLFEQFKANRTWAEITREMITAEGMLQLRVPDKTGAAAFLLGHIGPEAANERAAETSRVFLGIQIQCAQCHDHPFDSWSGSSSMSWQPSTAD